MLGRGGAGATQGWAHPYEISTPTILALTHHYPTVPLPCHHSTITPPPIHCQGPCMHDTVRACARMASTHHASTVVPKGCPGGASLLWVHGGVEMRQRSQVLLIRHLDRREGGGLTRVRKQREGASEGCWRAKGAAAMGGVSQPRVHTPSKFSGVRGAGAYWRRST